jgi:MoaA/NifB/PqqE/SkfB family radical SAM enzyme
VLANVHKLIELAKDKIKITVQFGTYENNEHQEEAFREYWASYPVQIFVRPKLTWCGQLEDHVRSQAPRHACPWIFDSININDDGSVPYCITDWHNQLPQGNVKHESIFDIWQSKIVPFLVTHARQDWKALPAFCQACPDWQTKPPRDQELLSRLADLRLRK